MLSGSGRPPPSSTVLAAASLEGVVVLTAGPAAPTAGRGRVREAIRCKERRGSH